MKKTNWIGGGRWRVLCFVLERMGCAPPQLFCAEGEEGNYAGNIMNQYWYLFDEGEVCEIVEFARRQSLKNLQEWFDGYTEDQVISTVLGVRGV